MALANQGKHESRRQQRKQNLPPQTMEVQTHPFIHMADVELLLEGEIERIEDEVIGVRIEKQSGNAQAADHSKFAHL
jgi:hypothetical protein